MPTVGDVIAGKYEITDLIGEGGMGSVYKAHHKLTGKKVAMKWMLPELAKNEDAVQRFLREAQAAGRIDHKNVVDIYDVGQEDGAYFLVMEYLIGEPLTDALERGGMSVADVIDCLIPAMRGVAAAHHKGVVHRDLKPDNIFLCRSEDGGWREPKVLDFGISKISEGEGSVNPRLTATGAVMGTPYYMSPEQIRGSHAVDQRTDVYAFGVILYEALCGCVPFAAETYSALILEIATGTPRPPREVNAELPVALEEIIMRAMAREPEDRYQDIESLAYALEMYGNHAQFSSMRPDPTGAHRVPSGTNPLAATAASGQMPAMTPASGTNPAYQSGPRGQSGSGPQAAAGIAANTSTPFTAERQSEEPLRIKKSNTGLIIAGGIAVAAAVLLGVFMGGGDGDVAEENVVQPETEPQAAAQPPAQEAAPPPAAAPSEDPTPAVDALPEGKVVEAVPEPDPAAKEEEEEADTSDAKRAAKKRRKHRKAAKRAKAPARAPVVAAPKPAAPPAPAAPTPAPKPRPTHKPGRTGTLRASDF